MTIMERVQCPGKKNIQAIVKESCPLAVYVPCLAQVLNLVLVKSCAIPEIHSTSDFIGNIASFFNQENARLITAIKSMSDRICNEWRLHPPGLTRWTEKDSAVLAFRDCMIQYDEYYWSSMRSQQNRVAMQPLWTLL